MAEIQLVPDENNCLTAVLATGTNLLLKVSLDIKPLTKVELVESHNLELKLYLTDYRSKPTEDKSITKVVKVDCEAKPFSFVSPHVDKFTSYKQYRDWLNKTHLSNEVSVTYDFKINPSVDAPELVKKVFHLRLAKRLKCTKHLPYTK